jgi:hypothetical protein
MSTIYLDGFDDYGPAGLMSGLSTQQLLNNSGWTFGNAYTTASIVAGINGESGNALYLPGISGGNGTVVSRTLPANYNRVIGGFRFNSALLGNFGVSFADANTNQCSVIVEAVSGLIFVVQGYGSPTSANILGQSNNSVSANTTHYLEFDATFQTNGTGGITVWLDGVQVCQGTGITSQSGNAWANMLQILQQPVGVGSLTIDDLYLFSATGAVNNSAVLSNPVIYTQLPTGDHQTQFNNIGNVEGNYYSIGDTQYAVSPNFLYLMAFTPNVTCTANDVVVQTYNQGTNSLAHNKAVLYSDSGGAPNTLLSSGTQVTGFVNNQLLTLPLSTPTVLTANTQYWAGVIGDSSCDFQTYDGISYLGGSTVTTTKGAIAGNTYSSGAPSAAPSMTYGQASVFLYVTCTGASTNWESVAVNPPVGDNSSVSANSAGVSDLYTFANLPTNIQEVFAVGVKGTAKLTIAGVHKLDLITLSGSTTSVGNTASIAPTLNYADYVSYFDTDPNTSVSWTVTGVNNSYNGISVAS